MRKIKRGNSVTYSHAGRIYRVLCLFIIFSSVLTGMLKFSAAPYPGYNYDSWGNSEPVPNGYAVHSVLRNPVGSEMTFSEPTDIYSRDGFLYVLDAGNKRVLILDGEYRLVRAVNRFTSEDGGEYELNNPNSIFVSSDGKIIIADTGNACVVISDMSGNILQVLRQPETGLFAEDIVFQPTKALADNKNNIYVISYQFYYGAVMYDENGEFLGYYGANRVVPSLAQLADLFWRRFMTDTQVSFMAKYVPIAYNSFDIDSNGFIYTCTGTVDGSENEIKKLNYLGNDVLQNQNDYNPGNKADYGDKERAVIDNETYDTNFIDICISSDGYINALDSQRGRVFQYDQSSNLITVFGGLGSQTGTFSEPVAVQEMQGRVLVLDKAKNSITVFEPTEYGTYLRSALDLYSQGRYTECRETWEQVLRLNANCELAYRGIGRACLQEGNFKEAMYYLKAGQDREGYSEAFRQQRTIDARKIFPYVIVALILLIAYAFLHKKINRRIRTLLHLKEKNAREDRTGLLTLLVHPLRFYDTLFEKNSRKVYLMSFVVVALMILAKTMEYMATGFIFNQNDLNTFNILPIIASSFGVVILWCAADWMTGSLKFGEGTFVKIWQGTAYATVPYTISVFIRILLSNVLTLEESAVLTLISFIGFVFSGFLLFNAVRTIQQYSVSGGIAMMLADAVVSVLILFILVLIFNLVREFLLFGGTIYSEIAYRI